MFKKRVLLSALVLILAMALLAGCGSASKKTANELLQEALIKSTEIKSASIDGTITLNLDVSDDVLADLGPEGMMVFDAIKNAKISYRGNYQLEPQPKYEITLSLDVKFDGLTFQFDVPILVEGEKVWVKIPNIPNMGLDGLAGKFIELDLKELAAMSGEELPSFDQNNLQANTKFAQELVPILFKHLDETYFYKVDPKTLALPEGLSASNAVEFRINQDQLRAFIPVFVEKILPEMLDVLSKPEYQQLSGLTPDMVAELKQDLTISKEEFNQGMNELDRVINNFNISGLFVIDKKGFMPQNTYTVSGDLRNPEGEGHIKFNMKMVANTSKINEPAVFENQFPPTDTISFEQLIMMMMGFGMGEDIYGGLDGWDNDDSDYATEDVDYEVLDALYEELSYYDWYNNNFDAILELYNNDDEFFADFQNPEVLRMLIDNQSYREDFFAYYGLEIIE